MKNTFSFFLVLFLVFNNFAFSAKKIPEKPIVIVTPSYKNSQWFENYINSILIQDYKNFRIIYLDDKSPDGMGDLIQDYLVKNGIDHAVINFDDSFSNDINTVTDEFVKQLKANKHFFILVRNVNRCGALQNLYRAIYSCDPDEIIATIDGDDWLAPRRDVLSQLNTVYSSAQVWFTHGAIMEYPSGSVSWSLPIPSVFVEKNLFRQFRCPSHLRTFYTWIFKKIKLEDLLYEGKFFPMTWDMAIMFPIAEMSGRRHAFIKDVNYIYNMHNPINDNKVDPDLQNKLDYYIRHQKPYAPLYSPL